MKIPRQYSSDCGFTIVEVFFAATLMLVGVVGMIQALTIGSQMLDVARKQTIAEQIIKGEIDKVRMNTWATINALPASSSATVADDGATVSGTNTGNLALTGNSNLKNIAKGFTCSLSVSNVRTDLRRATYTVTWTGNTGRTYSRKGDTYLGKNGLQLSYQQS